MLLIAKIETHGGEKMNDVRCVLKDEPTRFKLEIADSEVQVFSPKDDDGIWGTPFEDIEERPPFITLEQIDKAMKGEEVEVKSPAEYWTSKGYVIQKMKMYNGKPETVWIDINESLIDGVTSVFCPYCGHSHRVEPDANYTVMCEGCNKPFNVRSMI